jgi:hypothetical protein
MKTIKIQKLHKPEQVEAEFVIVIDVIRAFTTAAYAFDRGAEKIILVSTTQEAFALKKENPVYVLIGEVGGEHIPGFDYCNSPVKISTADLKGKTLVQRTSSGTQGVIRSITSKKILCSSFVVAQATLKRIQHVKPKTITFLITGGLKTEHKGEHVEAMVGQELLGYTDPMYNAELYYWHRRKVGGEAEVDYLIQEEEHVIPIEVKSGKGSTLKSMHVFLEQHKNSPYGVRFSTQNYSVYQNVRSLPLYAIASPFMHNQQAAFENLARKVH